MSLYAELRDLRNQRKKLAEQTNELLVKAAKENRSLTPREDDEWNRRHDDIDALADKIEIAEQRLARHKFETRNVGRGDFSSPDPFENRSTKPGKMTQEQREVTRRWMLGGVGALNTHEQRAYMKPFGSDEARALSAVTGTAGQDTIPAGFVYELDVALLWYGGIIAAASYLDTTTGINMPWPSINDTGNSAEGPLAENSAAAVNIDPVFGQVTFGAYMLDSGIVKIPIQLLQDSAFDLENYLVGGTDINAPMGDTGLLSIRIGRKLNNLATLGSGSSTLTGCVTAATLGKTGASPTSMTYNELLDLEHSVDPAYRGSDSFGRPRAAFMFNDSTLKALKKLTDGNSRPLWIAGGVSEGIQNKRPDTIDNFPYFINPDMAGQTGSSKSMLFGAFDRFKIRRVRGVQMVRFAERFMDSLQMGFLAFLRADSNIVDAGTHPLKYFQQSAT